MPVGARPGDVQKLLAQLGVRLVVAPPEGGARGRFGFADATHLGAEMDGLEIHRHAMRLQHPGERVGDLPAHPFLHREAPGEKPNQTGQLGDPDDVLVGDVAHVGVPEKRKGVVLAQRVEGDGTIDHLADLAVWAAFALGGKAVTSLASPSYPSVESNIALRYRYGVLLVPGVSSGIPSACRISRM